MVYPKLTDKPGALETAAAIRSGQLSVAEAVDAAITRIEQLDAEIDALAVPDFERAAETAKAMHQAGPKGDQPLFGVPMTVKESFDVAGLQSCWGHKEHTDYIAPRDSELVARMKAAGAVIVGKTNVPVDLTDWQSFNPVYGRTNNPHDTGRSPGGSSGGSAAAVASGMVPMEFGTDIGGSVRVPAHFCGVWAHKPTWGIISKAGHDHPQMAKQDGFIAAHDGILSVAGPLARNPQDLAAMMQVTSRYPLTRRSRPLKDCRILAVTDYPGAPVDQSVAEPTEAAIEALGKAGVTVDRKSDLLPDLKKQFDDYMMMLNVAMARGAPSPSGRRASATDWFDLLDAQSANQAQWAALFETYDFVIAPPAPVLAIEHSDKRAFDQPMRINGEEVPGASGLAWAGIATFPHLPSSVLPIGSGTHQGAELPCGMQIMGPLMSDLDCIAAAQAIGNILHS
ncbi:amidase family protein [Qipengyuania sp. S6317L1]|uniref:amidase family protein n=1 Tax=Qipengyuania sp. S6317L1 TaxID=2926410 RepID=UPI001FF33ACD|nr:amidase family protein [Qipengyuania sp. S6317L1]MCK0098023.1 amidase family protein [Qipengyuania sp. S6317L1]